MSQIKSSCKNLKDPTPSPMRRKFKSKRLTFDEVIDVCYRVIILKEYQHEVARHYRLTN